MKNSEELKKLKKLKESINSFHIHQYLNQTKQFKVLFATNTNKVFTFSSEQLIPQQINAEINAKQFIIGTDFVLVHTRERQVFGWGHNQFGQLGRGFISQDNQEDVQRVQQLNHIIEVCCGDSHSLALDQQRRVYGWGDNRSGQVGCGQGIGEKIAQPIQLNLPESVRTIYCSKNYSFAITLDGKIYSWGSNESFNLGQNTNQTVFEPTLIDGLAEVKITSICCSEQTYFLSEYNQIYFCGTNTGIDNQGQVLQPFNHQVPVDDLLRSLHSVNYYTEDNQLVSELIVLTDRFLYKLDKIKQLLIRISEYKSLFDYCSEEHQITYQTIDLNYEQRFPQRFLLNDSGCSARVYRAEDRIRCSEIAIKVFKQEYINKYNRKGIIREVTHMQHCSTEYVVQCYGYRFEQHLQQDLFYIMLELCSTDFKQLIEKKRIYFKRNENKKFCFFEYFISWLFFEEIVDCLNHLHETNLIHRDIKPDNILVKYESRNQKFFKLTDFGFAVTGTDVDLTYEQWIGTLPYMAPEVFGKTEYSNKADIHSLGILAKEIFGFDIKNNQLNEMQFDKNLEEKYQKLMEQFAIQMCCVNPEKRLNCSEIKEKFEVLKFDKFNVFKHFIIKNNWTTSELNDSINRFLNYYIPLRLNELCNEFMISLDEYASQPGKFTRFRDDGHYIYLAYLNSYNENKTQLNEHQEYVEITSDKSQFSVLHDHKYLKQFPDKAVLNEHQKNVKRVHKEREKYLSNYYDHFIYNSYLCIKLDYFEINLQTIINEKHECFGRNRSEPMSIIEYFISSSLIKEIVECVQSLHKNHIEHCDLTPFNIMVNEIPNDNVPDNFWFLKLANIGLTTFTPDFQITQILNEENRRYFAPEIISETTIERYTPEADIYSLGQIFCDLFDVDINSFSEDIKYDLVEYLKNKWIKLIELIKSMLSENDVGRPSCDYILSKFSEYAIENISKDIKSQYSRNFKLIEMKMNNYKNKFFIRFYLKYWAIKHSQ